LKLFIIHWHLLLVSPFFWLNLKQETSQTVRLKTFSQMYPARECIPAKRFGSVPGGDVIERIEVSNDCLHALALTKENGSNVLVSFFAPTMKKSIVEGKRSFDDVYEELQTEAPISPWFNLSTACGCIDLELTYPKVFRAGIPRESIGLESSSRFANIGEEVLFGVFPRRNHQMNSGLLKVTPGTLVFQCIPTTIGKRVIQNVVFHELTETPTSVCDKTFVLMIICLFSHHILYLNRNHQF